MHPHGVRRISMLLVTLVTSALSFVALPAGGGVVEHLHEVGDRVDRCGRARACGRLPAPRLADVKFKLSFYREPGRVCGSNLNSNTWTERRSAALLHAPGTATV